MKNLNPLFILQERSIKPAEMKKILEKAPRKVNEALWKKGKRTGEAVADAVETTTRRARRGNSGGIRIKSIFGGMTD